ncbi:membrane protein [Pilimelia terevasa]|uniref:Membrane protein n=1 Tax=Pilimelia terevasa TaxID=53372 RepID=A0A8J3BJ66_9ACTN|nr:DUF4307 domain-containing protein [Pilimelia terevasa]GGK14895.1 membrane protein [Pilimelia terevasa]
MTDTTGSNAPPAPVFPPGRYGRRREARHVRRSPWVAAGLACVVAAGVALAVRGYREFGDPAFTPQVISYTDATDTSITIHYRVHLRSGAGAVCAVRARSRDGTVVGRADAAVPAGAPVQRYVLRTTGRPFVGEVLRCRPA